MRVTPVAGALLMFASFVSGCGGLSAPPESESKGRKPADVARQLERALLDDDVLLSDTTCIKETTAKFKCVGDRLVSVPGGTDTESTSFTVTADTEGTIIYESN